MIKDFLSYLFTRTLTGAGIIAVTGAFLILKIRLILIQAWPWIAEYFVLILIALGVATLVVWETRRAYLHARKLQDERYRDYNLKKPVMRY